MTYEHNVRKFYIFKFLSSFFLIGPIIILFFLQHIPYSQFGIVYGVGVAVAFLFEIPSGVWADHIGRKYVVFMGTALSAIEIFLIAYGQSFPYFLAAGILGGIGKALISGADTALLYDSLLELKREKESRKIYGRLRAIRYISIVFAALIGAPLYIYQSTAPLYINSAIMLLAAFFFLTIKEPPIHGKTTGIRAQWRTFTKSLESIKSNAILIWFISFSVLSGLSVWLFHDLLRSPYYEAIGYPVAVLGIITAVVSVIRSVVSWNAHTIEKYFGERTTITWVLLAPIFLFALMSIVQTRVAVVLAIILYCVWSVQEVVTEVSLHEHMSSKERATIYSIHSFAHSIVLFGGALLVGYVAEQSLFLAIGLMAVYGAVVAAILLKTREKPLELEKK